MLTPGYVLCAALFVYPGTLNLEENIVFQYWSFATLIVLSAFFVVVFLSQSDFDSSRVPAVTKFIHVWKYMGGRVCSCRTNKMKERMGRPL